MKNLFQKVKELGIKKILLMTFGCFCVSLSGVIFVNATGMITGGSTGLAMLFERIFNIDYTWFFYIINFVLLVIALFLLGKDYTIKTLYGSIMLPTFTFLIKLLFKVTEFDYVTIVQHIPPTFTVLFASLLTGFGIGINLKLGGSTGGFDILESIGLKYFHVPYSVTMYIMDVFLIAGGMILFVPNAAYENFLAEGLGATIYIILQGIIVDAVSFGSISERAVFIRSEKYEEIRKVIIDDLRRGLTFLEAEGGFKLNKTKMIVTICHAREYYQLRDIIQQIDPVAFIFVTRASEVRGLGFNFETPEHLERHKKIKKTK